MVPECWLVGLWEHLEVARRWPAHNMRASRGQVIKKNQWDPRESCLKCWHYSQGSCSWCGSFVCCVFVDSISLRSHRRLNLITIASHHMFTQLVSYLSRCGRRVLRSGIRAWFTPHTGWVVCVGHACMSVACVSLTLQFHVLVAFTWCWSWL